jgi:hypothetical protein
MRLLGRDALNLGAVMLAIAFAGCPVGRVGGPMLLPADPCFDGAFWFGTTHCVADCPECWCEFTFLVTHEAVSDDREEPMRIVNGVVSGIAHQTAGYAATDLWESLRFQGEVWAVGEARGTLFVDRYESREEPVEDVTLLLSEEPISGCPDRLELGFSYMGSDGSEHTEEYVAWRTPRCARRRPECALSPIDD